MMQSSVESTPAPEWLVRLEQRREQIRPKLSHESGNGAPCIVCGTGCPGLDLHFWRKICRNCKCRKEQHDCIDDSTSGWAQFEILGAIRSKPAYIQISKLADKPLQLTWVPPNVSAELASDYMLTLGPQNIPIAGSEAAEKRKQQLEFQVPPHDLDTSLCHNLSQDEEALLEKHAEKVRNNCAGQGEVIRVGESDVPSMGAANLMEKLRSSPAIQGALTNTLSNQERQNFNLTQERMKADFAQSPVLSDKTKYKLKLMGVDSAAIESIVRNGPEIDALLTALDAEGVCYEGSCQLLEPLKKLRREYLGNSKFRVELDNFVANVQPQTTTNRNGGLQQIDVLNNPCLSQETKATLQRMKVDSNTVLSVAMNGPLYDQLLQKMRQHRVQFANDPLLSSIDQFRQECANNSDFQQDIANLLLQPDVAIQCNKLIEPHRIRSTQSNPFLDDNVRCTLESGSEPPLRAIDIRNANAVLDDTADKLDQLNIPARAMESAIAFGPVYDELFADLSRNHIVYPNDPILGAIGRFRDEFHNRVKFAQDLPRYGQSLPPCADAVLAPAMQNMNLQPGSTEAIHPSEMSPLSCQGCRQPLAFGGVAVKADRAGKNSVWHPQCFRCAKCDELLADLVYFYHGGRVYCGRDLAAILKIPRCSACDELIFAKNYTAAEGATFHVKHFCCYHCDAPLAGQQYVPDEKSNMPVCLECYDRHFAKPCRRCGNHIGPAEQGVAWGTVHWHGSCFVCAGPACQKSLIGGKFCVKNEMPFCSQQCFKSSG